MNNWYCRLQNIKVLPSSILDCDEIILNYQANFENNFKVQRFRKDLWVGIVGLKPIIINAEFECRKNNMPFHFKGFLDITFSRGSVNIFCKLDLPDKQNSIELSWSEIRIEGMQVNFHETNHKWLIKMYKNQIVAQLRLVLTRYLTEILRDFVINLNHFVMLCRGFFEKSIIEDPLELFLLNFGFDEKYDAEEKLGDGAKEQELFSFHMDELSHERPEDNGWTSELFTIK
jgi:hypothetical protein